MHKAWLIYSNFLLLSLKDKHDNYKEQCFRISGLKKEKLLDDGIIYYLAPLKKN